MSPRAERGVCTCRSLASLGMTISLAPAFVEQLLQDFRYSLRVLRQQPAFTFAAVAALALGIGATTAVFSVVNAVLLKPMPYPDAERIVMFENVFPQGTGGGASPAKFAHWSRQTSVIQDPAAFRNVTVNFTGTDTPEQL